MTRFIAAVLLVFASCAQAADDPHIESHPWAWWDAGAKTDLEIKATFDFEKKSRTRRKPLKLEGSFCLRRSKETSVMLLQFSRKTEKGLEKDSTVLIDSGRWWTLTHQREGVQAILEKVDLSTRPGLRGAVHALAFLHGKSRVELEKYFTVEISSAPDPRDLWAFKLTPKSEEDRGHVKAMTVSMERESLKSLHLELPREEWVSFTFRALEPAKLGDKDLVLEVPEGAEIVEDDAAGDGE